jgi:hypothetical protein
MRLFVLYDRDGTVRSAMKVEVMGEGLDHPYAPPEEGQAVLEAEITDELRALAPREICERFGVDPQRRELVAKGAPPPPPPRGGRRRGSGQA